MLRPRLILALLAGMITLAGCDREPQAPAQPRSNTPAPPASADFTGRIDRSHHGAAMPVATLTDATGARLTLSSLHGKPVLINLWATWCAPCVKELPTLDALAAREGDRLVVLTVSQDMGTTDKIAATLRKNGMSRLPLWVDADNTLGFFYNTGELPTSVLYDVGGKEVWRMVGAHDWSGKDTDAMIADARLP